MEKLRIAFLQILPGKTLEESLRIGTDAVRKAKDLGADIALFPEMFSIGYRFSETQEAMNEKAVGADSGFVQAFRVLAKNLGLAIGVTYLEEDDPQPRNTISVFDRFGNILYRYAKVHTCDFGDEILLKPGERFYTEDLDTEKGFVRVGSMICYDREFPESARILMLQGAELLLVPNACPMELNRLSQLRGRAYENMLAIATCNYPAGVPDCNGHSSLFDGVAYLPHIPGSRDMCVFEAPESPGIYTADLDIDMLRTYREKEVHGNAFRKPQLYGSLTVEGKEYPFIRKEYRG